MKFPHSIRKLWLRIRNYFCVIRKYDYDLREIIKDNPLKESAETLDPITISFFGVDPYCNAFMPPMEPRKGERFQVCFDNIVTLCPRPRSQFHKDLIRLRHYLISKIEPYQMGTK